MFNFFYPHLDTLSHLQERRKKNDTKASLNKYDLRRNLDFCIVS